MEFKKIMEQMLDKVPDELDKREGSVIYTTIAPVAYELSKAYWILAWVMNLFMPDTANDEWLDKLVVMFGVQRKKATKAIRQLEVRGTNDELINIALGSRFRVETLSLVVIEEISKGTYKAEAEQEGTIGNQFNGSVLPVSNIQGLGSAKLVDVLLLGTEAESDEDLRERFYLHVQMTSFAGNVPDYLEKTMSLEGVGAVEVFPVWNGPGSVLLVIADESERDATDDLIKNVQDYFQPSDRPTEGLAPIGHVVTVKTSTVLELNITGAVRCAQGTSFTIVQEQMKVAIEKYINQIKFKEGMIYLSRLVVEMLNVESVIDVQNVTINGKQENLVLNKDADLYQVPKVKTITLTQVIL